MNLDKCVVPVGLGSARASRAVCGALAANSLEPVYEIAFGGAPNTAREGACAPQKLS